MIGSASSGKRNAEKKFLRESIARHGPEVVSRHYAMDVIARKYLALYEDLMGVECRTGG